MIWVVVLLQGLQFPGIPASGKLLHRACFCSVGSYYCMPSYEMGLQIIALCLQYQFTMLDNTTAYWFSAFIGAREAQTAHPDQVRCVCQSSRTGSLWSEEVSNGTLA